MRSTRADCARYRAATTTWLAPRLAPLARSCRGPIRLLGRPIRISCGSSQTSYNPTGPDAAYARSATAAAGNVTDATPRLVSNLVATSFTTGTYANPAAIEAVTDFYGDDARLHSRHLPVTPTSPSCRTAGVLGGGRYNAWFVAFGQFFDHGLDFVQKGASGTITIDIMSGDPLYVDPFLPDNVTPNPDYVPGVSNIMRVSRANLANPDSDFVSGMAPARYRRHHADLQEQHRPADRPEPDLRFARHDQRLPA